MALLSCVDSTPRAYRLKAGNAARKVSTDAGTSPLIGARLTWGVVGTRHALFISFIAGPRAVLRYVRLLRDGYAPRYLGHNPAGGAMVAALLVLLVIVSGSGWLSETDAYFSVPWVDHLHHYSAHLLLALVGLHLAGVIVSSWLHRENLVLPMLTGRKPLHLSGRAKFRARMQRGGFVETVFRPR